MSFFFISNGLQYLATNLANEHFSMNKLREEVAMADAMKKKKELEEGPKAAFGYGGKFGVQSDR